MSASQTVIHRTAPPEATPTDRSSPSGRRGRDELQIPTSSSLRSVRTPASLRKPSRIVGLLLLLVTAILIGAPWWQTVAGEGRVIAYSPLDRSQVIEAPIEGRVARFYVQEGSTVRLGDPIADIVDNDPEILSRLRSEREAIESRMAAANARVAAVESRRSALDGSRKAALAAAAHRTKMAQDRVTAALKAVEASEAARKTAALNLERQRALVDKGLVSNRSMELADLDFTRSQTDLDRALAAVALARSEQLAFESDRLKIDADTAASLDDALATIATASAEVANAKVELQRIELRLARQGAMAVKAPRDGTVLRLLTQVGGEMLKPGDSLAMLVPDGERAVEIFVDGRDVPLLREGKAVRLQFEGWPAVQFSGWPSVAVGTFGGTVAVIDATDYERGKFRVVVVPDGRESWPESMYLRQGVRAHGWFILGRVPLGYELWRIFNGFPPSVKAPAGPVVKKGK